MKFFCANRVWEGRSFGKLFLTCLLDPPQLCGISQPRSVWHSPNGYRKRRSAGLLRPSERCTNAGLGPVLEECCNVSLGLGNEAAGTLPANLRRSPQARLGLPSRRICRAMSRCVCKSGFCCLNSQSRKPVGINLDEGVLQFVGNISVLMTSVGG